MTNIAATDFSGKTAFVTGGAQGIGFAIAEALAKRGANIMLADINEAGLIQAKENLSKLNTQVEYCLCDVANADAVQAGADKTIERFGKVHYVVNNAGVALGGAVGETPLNDWRWIVDINLMGVVYGCEIFTPLIKSHGEGGHIVNTASMAGHVSLGGMGPYHATKFAVVGYSECIRQELAPYKIGVSALCPGWVQTEIHLSTKNSPTNAGTEVVQNEQFLAIAQLIENGLEPNRLGEWVADSIVANRQYIFTHPDMRPAIEMRYHGVQADYAACDKHFGE
jgi:NAD(P)-dependent dehydrogenase (short-subunit alcohol dehydrogenase family)